MVKEFQGHHGHLLLKARSYIQFGHFQQMLFTFASAENFINAKLSFQAVQSFPPLAATTFKQLSLSKKVLLFSVALGGTAILFLTKYFKRKRRPLTAR